MAGSYEHGNEPSGSTKGGEFHDWVTTSFSRRSMLHVISWIRVQFKINNIQLTAEHSYQNAYK